MNKQGFVLVPTPDVIETYVKAAFSHRSVRIENRYRKLNEQLRGRIGEIVLAYWSEYEFDAFAQKNRSRIVCAEFGILTDDRLTFSFSGPRAKCFLPTQKHVAARKAENSQSIYMATGPISEFGALFVPSTCGVPSPIFRRVLIGNAARGWLRTHLPSITHNKDVRSYLA